MDAARESNPETSSATMACFNLRKEDSIDDGANLECQWPQAKKLLIKRSTKREGESEKRIRKID